MAYANERFASKLPGWKTDRGRTYIVWGPPDEIESHPRESIYARPAEEGGGSAPVFPFEAWLYRQIEGVGTNVSLEFVDRTGWGEFEMVADPLLKYRSDADDPAGATFFSTESGARAVVAVTPERTVMVRIPIDFAAKQHFVRVTIHSETGLTADTVDRLVSVCQYSPRTWGCLERPVLEVVPMRGTRLEPGDYQLDAVVKDSAGSGERMYQVHFLIK